MVSDDLIQQAARHIRAARQLTILTGAGVSKESGVPTFRDAREGLWATYDPQELATPIADLKLEVPSGEVLPRVVEAL